MTPAKQKKLLRMLQDLLSSDLATLSRNYPQAGFGADDKANIENLKSKLEYILEIDEE